MTDVKRTSRGGRGKRSPKTETTREKKKSEETVSPEAVAEESSAETAAPEEVEVAAVEEAPPVKSRAKDAKEEGDAPEASERTRDSDTDEDEPLDADSADADDGDYDDEDLDDEDEDEDDVPPRRDEPRDEPRGGQRQETRGGRGGGGGSGGGGGRQGQGQGGGTRGGGGGSGGGGDKNRVAPDEYLLQVRYDRNARQFVGTCGEFPELKVTGNNRDHTVEDLEIRVEDHISTLRRDGRKVPEPIQARRYPERLEVRVSQNLQRRLDLLSRQEKVGLDQLVTELLTHALDRKETPARQEKQHHQGGGNRHGNNSGGNQQRHPQHSGRRAGRNFHDTMENRENFMEYVRNLEKGNLKKR